MNLKSEKIKDIPGLGTTYYKATLDQVIDVYLGKYENVILSFLLGTLEWDVLNFRSALYGSDVIDDVLYICVTDGMPIDVNGEEVDPEEALQDYDISELSEYIKPADSEIISKYVTEYEFNPIDIDSVAVEMLEDGYSFQEIAQSAIKIDLIEA